MMAFHKIGIIGLGLMGGSILKGLEGKKEVITDNDLLERLDEIDILILAVPISAILEIGEKIAKLPLTRSLIVFDIGSVKEQIASRFEEWSNGKVEFVATHPMAGKEQSGFAFSDAHLFQEVPWIITPHKKNTEAALLAVEEIIQLLGAAVQRMDAKTHDKRAALVSHLSYIISKSFFELVIQEDPKSLEMAGPGFQSMTRLSRDNPILHAEIGIYNKRNISAALKKFIAILEHVK
jgi:prephenate dehydrogenase